MSAAVRRAAFYHVDTDGLAAIYRAHGQVWEGARDGFFLSAVERSLQFFASQQAKATYFVIASDLRDKDKRAALREVVGAGHAVASHGLHHRYLDRSTPAEKREEIFEAKAMIEHELGAPVRGFRAPGYAIDAESLELLGEAGYAYDSSITANFAFREKLGLQRLYPDPFEILPDRGLMEFPLPAPPPGLPAFHPCFAFYLRRAYFRAGLRSHAKRADHLTLLFHFTDFAEPQDEIRGLGLRFFTNNFFSGDAKQSFLARLAADVRETWAVTTTEQFLAERRHEEPRLRPRTILGVATTHETGACVVRDGKLLSAVTEERLSRKKMDNAYPPVLSIREAIRVSGIRPEEIDAVAIAGLEWRDLLVQTWRSLVADARDYQGLSDYVPHFLRIAYRFFSFWRSTGYERVLDFLETELGVRPKAWYIDHHHAHAASAYRSGAAQDALIVTADGVGDDVCITFSEARGRTIRTKKRYFYPNSFGQFYSACTQILGFKAGHHEGKITGLAGFGKQNPELLAKVESTFTRDDGFRLGKRFYAEGFPRLRARVFSDLFGGKLGVHSFEYRNYKAPLKPLLDGHTREDVAWTFQHLLEREMVRMIREIAKSPVKNIALAGGVFANVKLNMAISQELKPESLFIFPAMGDGGLCAGAALELAACAPTPAPNVYLGTGYGEAEIAAELARHPELEVIRPDNIARFAAEQLAVGKIVARCDGRMEYGPRALGNRSVLVRCDDSAVNQTLNKQFNRTEFMPFAPICLYEDADEYFVLREGEKRACEFMTLVTDCTEKMRTRCPAAVHVDGTARPQLVRADQNPGMHAILTEYKRITGLACTINTSFNMHEEPIVRTPEEAISAFQQSRLDWLLLGPFMVREKRAEARRA